MAEYKFRWPCWWGGEAVSDTAPQIASRLVELRREVGGLKAEVQRGGPRFAIKSSKELMGKLRDALDKLGLVDFVCSMTGGNIPLGDDTDGTLAFLMATVRIGAPDGSFAELVGAGHGADQQDKAAGKASTYAWKDAHVKGLDLPDADMVDTDDDERPLPGGLRQKRLTVSKADVELAIERATNLGELQAAGQLARGLSPDERVQVQPKYNARKGELAQPVVPS